VWVPDVGHPAEPEHIGIVISDRVAGPVSKDRDVFAHESLLRWPMEILQISIRRLSVVNATDATDPSGGPSLMLFEDQDRVLPHAMESKCRNE
jgi:hypothetical protein